MILYISELMLFLGIIGVVGIGFLKADDTLKTNQINYGEVIKEVNNGNSYKNLYINSKVNKKDSNIYKEMVLEFNEGELSPLLCNYLNK